VPACQGAIEIRHPLFALRCCAPLAFLLDMRACPPYPSVLSGRVIELDFFITLCCVSVLCRGIVPGKNVLFDYTNTEYDCDKLS
jgi:hypothetical protein